ncbi:upstream activation factor subunit spp27-like [Silene latifolia]|uniref:upstream activation factor subunit spp27-like n=1 Tax=Silene latifolia TaxID=37657 RepID=UPI003D77C898
MPVSPILKDFLGGTPEASRGEAVKKVWAYIKLHNLQVCICKKQIICDQKLKTLFSDKETVGFMEVSGLLSKHFVKIG